MLYLFLVVLIIAIFFFTRNLLLKREVRKVREQLEKYNHQSTNKKVDIALFDQNIEMLAKEINLLIDFHGQEKRERIRFENELKQTVANMSHDLRTPLTS